MEYQITKEKLLEGVEKMNSFGARYTGSEAHQNFIESLKKEIRELGRSSISFAGLAPQ